MEKALAITSSLFSIVSLVFSVYTFYWTKGHDCKQATLEAFNRLQAEALDPLNAYSPSDIEDICEDTKSVEYKRLSGYLARIEHFCAGINTDIYDKEVFYYLAHNYFDRGSLRNRITPLLEAKNGKQNGTELNYVNIYDVLGWMKKRCEKK